MKRIIQILSLVTFMSVASYGANLPVIGGAISQNQVNAGSGDNFFLIAVNDGDPLLSQNVTVTGISSNTSLLQITSIEFNSSNTFVTVHTANTSPSTTVGIVTVTISAMDIDGTSTKSFSINVGDFYTKGASFKVYDIVFWQHIVPVKQSPKIDVIINQTAIPQGNEFYRPAKLAVGAGMACCGYFTKDQEFSYGFTNAITGFIKPTVSGIYSFANSSENGAIFYINTNPGGNLYNGNVVNTCSGLNCNTSLYLEAGQYYGFHTANWIVYSKTYQFLWSGPGINTFQPIAAPYIYPLYDRVNPSAPTALTLVNKGVTFMTLKWKGSTDNDKVAGYNLYKDGVKLISLNDSLYVVTALGYNTLYSYAVTSFDRVGNESIASNILSSSTYAPDIIAPLPPTEAEFLSTGDMSVEVSWSGASDVGSEIIGYYVYLNGALYNTQYVTDNQIIIKVLKPSTNYKISIVAFDGAFNRSVASTEFAFTTRKFDESFKSVGVKKAKAVIHPTAIARNAGFGINFDWGLPKGYTGIWQQYMYDLEPGAIRWGGFAPNHLSFSATTGVGKEITIGRFLKYAMDNNAHALFTCGVQQDTDWMLNSATFIRFMEYIGDPTGQTPGGALRIAEGYIDPFTDGSKPIIFEFGNEVWGASVHYAEIGANYSTYGHWCRQMAAVIKSSPYYDSTKLKLVYSGRNPDPAESYGLHNALFQNDHHEVDWLSLSGYMGGNLNYDTNVPQGDTELDYYKSGTAAMLHNLTGLKQTMDGDLNQTGRYRPMYFYEGNMTTPDYNGRMGQAVIMSDYYLSSMKLGVALPAMFLLTGGEWSLTDPTNGDSKLPFFNIGELVNTQTKGNILKSDIKSIELLEDASGLKIGGDPVGVHVFSNGTKYSIAMLSRDFDSDYQVQLILPKNGKYGTNDGNGNYTAQKYVVSSNSYNTRGATTSRTTVSLSDSMIVTVPKYSVVLYVFDGPDLKRPLLPLGYTKYLKNDNVKIIPTSDNSDITLQYGSATFTVTSIAMSVIDKRIGWDIQIPDGLSVTVDTSAGAKVFASGTCGGNGVVTITAYAMDDPYVKDMVLVSITGQMDDGLETCKIETTDLKKSIGSNLVMYPNPSEGVLNLYSNSLQLSEVKIYNSSGVFVFDKVLQNGIQTHQLELSSLPSGLYLVKVNTSKGDVTRKVRIN